MQVLDRFWHRGLLFEAGQIPALQQAYKIHLFYG